MSSPLARLAAQPLTVNAVGGGRSPLTQLPPTLLARLPPMLLTPNVARPADARRSPSWPPMTLAARPAAPDVARLVVPEAARPAALDTAHPVTPNAPRQASPEVARPAACPAALNAAHPYAHATEPNLFEGRAFRALSDVQREEIAERISVIGRSSPNGKLLLVQALKIRGHVVAVTGDGTNDAPTLNEAHIGLAMGIQRTKVAKESSDIIILDDNFASVVRGDYTRRFP